MSKIRVGIIGVGAMGQNHARVYSALPEANLVGVCDHNSIVGRQIAGRFEAKFYNDASSLLKDIDAVTIATPTITHFDVASKALEAGKHVLIEKPICVDAISAQKLCDLASQLGLTLAVGHIERHNPVIALAKHNIEQGKFGEIISFSAKRVSSLPSRIKDVGVILDIGTHEIDNCRYLVNSEVEKVHAFGGSRNHRFEDFAIISLVFNSGVCAHIEANWLTPMKVRRASITCSKAFVEIDYTKQLLQISSAQLGEYDLADMSHVPWEYSTNSIPLQKQEPLKRELQDFLNAISHKRAPLVTGKDGLEVIKIASAAIESCRRKEVINIE